MTRTKATDRNGNVSYTLTEGGEVIGYVHRCSGYWRAELPSGSGAAVSSLKKGEETIVFWRRMANRG